MAPASLALACAGAALLATLVLAARCTPQAWWRRPNARALAVLLLGTGVIGGALWLWLAPATAVPIAAPPAVHGAGIDTPRAGRSYRVADALNLRAERGVGARRVLVLPPGSVVRATGKREGDWWQVSAELGGERVEGWASSLWLRRADEHR